MEKESAKKGGTGSQQRSESSTDKVIVALVPYAHEILTHWEVPGVVYLEIRNGGGPEALLPISEALLEDGADIEALITLQPDVVVTDSLLLDDDKELSRVTQEISALCGKPVRIVALASRTLEGSYGAIEHLGVSVGKAAAAREMCNRIKAQIMDWCDSFYDRMKNKKVTVLSSISPIRVAGRWIPDLVKAASCHPQFNALGAEAREIVWGDVVAFRPDVIVVSPEGYSLDESVRTLKLLERMHGWEEVPAVKRGEVIFLDGVGLYRPGPKILSGIASLISAIAGLESGYITARDAFYRLRWVELHRHKF